MATAALFTRPSKTAKTPRVTLRRLMDIVNQIKAERGEGRIKSFASFSAFQDNSSEENKRRQQELKQRLQAARIGFISQQGIWVDPNTGEASGEPSIVAFNISKDDAIGLMGAYDQQAEGVSGYDQQAVVYAGPETEGKIMLFWNNGSVEELGTMQTMTHQDKTVVDSFENQSRIKGQPYVFAPEGEVNRRRESQAIQGSKQIRIAGYGPMSVAQARVGALTRARMIAAAAEEGNWQAVHHLVANGVLRNFAGALLDAAGQ